MNLAQLAEDNIRLFGEYPFLTFNDRAYTNVQVDQMANRLAHGLKSLGLRPGQAAVVMMPNCPEVIISFQAIFKCGATVIPALFTLSAREVHYILQDSEATTIITSSRFLDKVREAVQDLPTVKNIIVADGEAEGVHSLQTLLAQGSDDGTMVETHSEDVAVMIYTAGTTGRPKGVMLTHLNLYSNAKLTQVTYEFSEDNPDWRSHDAVALIALPLAHSYGLTVMNAGYLTGARHIVMPWFEAEPAMTLIQKYRITDFSAVPTMYVLMLNHQKFGQYDLSSVRAWGSGSAPLPIEIQDAWYQKVGQPIREGYGLSEYSPIVSTQRRNRSVRKGSVGVPIFGTETQIVDLDNRSLPVGEAGELVVRGPCIMKGYYKLPETTARALHDGWLHTGDIARRDEDGYLYILERKDDMILRGGENIYPREVEEVLYRHPAVAEAAIIGMPDPVMQQEIHGFVVLKPGQVATETELMDYCEANIAKFKTPKTVTFLEAMPKSQVGKILRKELRRMYREKATP